MCIAWALTGPQLYEVLGLWYFQFWVDSAKKKVKIEFNFEFWLELREAEIAVQYSVFVVFIFKPNCVAVA